MDGILDKKAKQKLAAKPWPKPNPFLPGSGTPPPHLAGRQDDLALFEDCLVRLGDRKTPAPGPMVLFAPRGAGKTALLTVFEDMAEETGVKVCRIDPVNIASLNDLLLALADELSDGKVAMADERIAKLSVRALAFLKGEASVREKRDVSPKFIAAFVGRKTKEQPIVISVDEAHTLTKEVGAGLLQAEQTARRTGAKVQLILAGTPDLKDHLATMGVSFWDRLGKRLRHLNLLDRDDAAESIEVPFTELSGVSLDDGAKDRIFELTSGYPYFSQLMGESLWDKTPEDSKTLTREDVDRAAPEFIRGKNTYYQRRFAELRGAAMVGPAFAAALAYKRTVAAGGFTEWKMQQAVRLGATLGIDADDIDDAPTTGPTMSGFLLHKGFMWVEDETTSCLVPGIPTLVDFVFESVLSEHPDTEQRLLKDMRFKQLLDAASKHTHSHS